MCLGKCLGVSAVLFAAAELPGKEFCCARTLGMRMTKNDAGIELPLDNCPEPYPKHLPVEDCWCLGHDKMPLNHKDGTLCHKRDRGYNQELTWKGGKCPQGKCKSHHIPFGCRDVSPRAATNPPQIGCTFICTNGNKDRSEFGFLKDGSPCKHIGKDNKPVTGECKTKKSTTICVPNPKYQ